VRGKKSKRRGRKGKATKITRRVSKKEHLRERGSEKEVQARLERSTEGQGQDTSGRVGHAEEIVVGGKPYKGELRWQVGDPEIKRRGGKGERKKSESEKTPSKCLDGEGKP